MLANRRAIPARLFHAHIFRCAEDFLEDDMTKPRRKRAAATLPLPCPEVERIPDEVRRILWGIASDSEESGTARTAACRLLLMDARERGDGGEARLDADLDRRARELLRRVAN
jgi:hypothetical protein